MEITFEHGLTYRTDKKIPIQYIAESLLSNERLLKEAGTIITGLVEGLDIEGIEISLRHVSQESPLKEMFWGAVIFTYQESLVKEVPQFIEQAFGVDMPDQYQTLITIMALLLAFYGVDFIYRKLNPDASSHKIKQMLDGLVKDVAVMLGKSEDEVRDKLAVQYSDSRIRQLVRSAVGFFSPAKVNRGTSIIPTIGPVIGSDVIDDIPSQGDVDDFEPDDKFDPLEDVEIEIHSQDVDKTRTGWSGVIKGVHEKRLRMQLYPPIKPEDIYTKVMIRGDIILVSRTDKSGDYVPHMFHLVRLHSAV